jgi:hypothetical protein
MTTTSSTRESIAMFKHLPNTQMNSLYDEDKAAHDWYRFVLSFPAHLVREYLDRFNVGADGCVLDPFCGTGTTIVECKRLGVSSVGVEANPMAYFASSVKTDWSVSGDDLLAHAKSIAEKVRHELANGAWHFNDSDKHSLFDCKDTPLLKVLPPEAHDILLTNSISPIPLHKTLTLLEQINRKRDKTYHRHELLALAKSLVGPIGNLHFGPEVGVGKPKKDAPVVESWMDGIGAMASDLAQLEPLRKVPSRIYHADSRDLIRVLKPRSISAVITSPPYPNEKDYTRTTRLESVVLGFVKNKAELKAFKQQLLRSNTRNVYKADTDDKWIVGHPKIAEIAEAIEARRIELGKTSGFERLYARVTKLYFGGMARHLADLRPLLRPKARLAYVVGDQASYLRIMIRTGQLLAEIAESLGYRVISIDLFRTRLATATKEQLREEVVVLEWNGKSK